uniref:SMK-1 domain-containing protein n=1 Tax=Steinernema glaseri TaxID=37863 RepID=A0A1I8AGL3_9BILA
MSSSEGDTDTADTKKPTETESSQVNGHDKKNDTIITNGGLSKNLFDKYQFTKDAHNRVKMYVLLEQRLWDDRGTGHVACVSAPESPHSYSIIVRLENSEKNILESKIQVDTIYQKQQETLIVWSESESCDLALSFQEKSGCEEIWETICRVQGKDPDEVMYDNDSDGDGDGEVEGEADGEGEAEGEGEPDGEAEGDVEEDIKESAPSPIPSTSSHSGSSLLPPCEISKLSDIEAALANSLATAETREKMATAVEREGYIARLCNVFKQCEQLELLDACRTMYMIAKNLFYLNRANLLEYLLDVKYLRFIVGMLEYDPSAPARRKHREFLFEQSRFREVLPIQKEELREKIHDNFRAQYVQDVCLPAPSILEENLLTVLGSHLFFNRIEIVKLLSEDKILIGQLFDELKDKTITVQRRKELASFLKEFCSYSQSLQPNGPQGRDMFLKLLMSNDVLAAVELCIISPDHRTRAITVDLLNLIVENNPTFVRDYLVQQGKKVSESNDDDLLINRMIRQMFKDKDPELTSAMQMCQVLRSLVDPENMTAKTDKTEFLPFFYRRSITALVQPLLDNTEKGFPAKDTYYVANQQALILELLSFCIQHHSFSMRNYCMHHDLLNRVLVLMKSKHHFLALYALRLFRRVLNLRDEFYVKYIARESVLTRVIDAFVANGRRYNVMNSAILELFEFVAHDNVVPLVAYAVENHWDQLESVDYVETFRSLKRRYEANKREREGTPDSLNSDTSASGSIRSEQWKKEQECDKEENWFGSGDDDDDCWYDSKKDLLQHALSSSSLSSNGDLPSRKSGQEPNYPSIAKRPTSLLDDDGVASVFGGSSTPINGNKLSISAPKIVIKVPSLPSSIDRSRSPSPATSASRSPSPSTASPSTSSPSKAKSPSPTPNTPYMLKEVANFTHGGLVDYDESDSDDEDEAPSSSNSQVQAPSSNSGTSSPTEEETPTVVESTEEEPKKDVEKEKPIAINGHCGNKRPRSFEGTDHDFDGEGETTDVEKDFTPERKRCRLDEEESKCDERPVPSPTAAV